MAFERSFGLTVQASGGAGTPWGEGAAILGRRGAGRTSCGVSGRAEGKATTSRALRGVVVASLAGGCVYYGMYLAKIGSVVSAVTGIAVVFTIRMLATAFRWSLPKIH